MKKSNIPVLSTHSFDERELVLLNNREKHVFSNEDYIIHVPIEIVEHKTVEIIDEYSTYPYWLDSLESTTPEANLLSTKSINWVQPIPTAENRKGNVPSLAKRKALRAKRKKR